MKTAFWLVAQYDGKFIIPVETVSRDFFDLSTQKFLRKVSTGEIALPIVRMEASQKAAKGVYVDDLADYIDTMRAAAKKELQQLNRGPALQ